MGNLSHMFPTAPGLDRDLGSVGMLLECLGEGPCSMEFSEYYKHPRCDVQGKCKSLCSFITQIIVV